MFKYLFHLSIIFVLGSLGVCAQERDSLKLSLKLSLESQIDSIVTEAIAQEAFPGCVVYAMQQDSALFFKSYGYHTYDSIQPVSKRDIYDLASITKIAGATLSLMKLYEDSLIHLDQPIGSYIKGIGKVGKVSLRAVLAHQGGLHPWIPYYQRVRKKDGTFKAKAISTERTKTFTYALSDSLYLAKDFYHRIKKLIKKSEVKKYPVYQYSGLFFYLVPELVENLTGIAYEDYLNQYFFDPMHASTLRFNAGEHFSLDVIVPTEIDTFFRREAIHGKVHDEGAIMMNGVSGNAGLFGNAEDIGKVMQMLSHHGAYDTMQLLNPQTVALFSTVQFPNLKNRRGLGFDKPLLRYDSIRSSVAKSASHRSFGHTGYTGTLAWADPENDLVFIFLSNRVYPTRKNTALYRLNVRPTIHQLLYDYLEKSEGNLVPVQKAK